MALNWQAKHHVYNSCFGSHFEFEFDSGYGFDFEFGSRSIVAPHSSSLAHNKENKTQAQNDFVKKGDVAVAAAVGELRLLLLIILLLKTSTHRTYSLLLSPSSCASSFSVP